jgi:hypothetical protein
MSGTTDAGKVLPTGTEISKGDMIADRLGSGRVVCTSTWGCIIDQKGDLVGKDMPAGVVAGIIAGVVALIAIPIGWISYTGYRKDSSSGSNPVPPTIGSGGTRRKRHSSNRTRKHRA